MSRKDQYLDQLAAVPLFRGLPRKDLERIAQQADTLDVEAGRVVAREGEHGQEFFVVLDGCVAVTRSHAQVATLGPGSFFGELSLLDPAPRDATVQALVPSRLLVVDARRFAPLLEDVPHFARRISAGLARRLRDADRQPAWQ